METEENEGYVSLDTSSPIWKHVFMAAPLVVIGTREGDGYDLAPKHMAFPAGFDNFFGFVCTPKHATYQNILEHGEFTVSFPVPDELLVTSLTASSRETIASKQDNVLHSLPAEKAVSMDLPVLKDAYLRLECARYKVIDGFGSNSIITGTIKAASVKKAYLRVSDMDEQVQLMEHNLLTYIAPGRFARIRETYNFPFPKSFKL